MIKCNDFSRLEYWDNRFGNEESFEWLQTWDAFGETLMKLLDDHFPNIDRKDINVLVVGCGTNDLGPHLFNAGWKKLTNLDFSGVLIDKMKSTYSSPEYEGMCWTQGNCLHLKKYKDGSFDAIIDKATLDAISCDGDEATRKATTEFHRILRGTGGYFLISYSKYRLESFIDEDKVNQLTAEDEYWKCNIHHLFIVEGDDNGSISCPSNIHYLFLLVPKKGIEDNIE